LQFNYNYLMYFTYFGENYYWVRDDGFHQFITNFTEFVSTFEGSMKFWILFKIIIYLKCLINLQYFILFIYIFIFNFFVGRVNSEILFFIFLDEDIVVGNVELMDLEDNVLPVQIMIKIWWWYRLFYFGVKSIAIFYQLDTAWDSA